MTAALLGILTPVVAAPVVFFLDLAWENRLNPHDGQAGIGAMLLALILAPVAGLVCAGVYWLLSRPRVR